MLSYFEESVGLLLRSAMFRRCLVAAIISGIVSAVLFHVDRSGYPFLEQNLPDEVVFNVFIVFASLVAGFRTAHALSRYTEAAALLHKLHACWFDVASTLVAFCRTSTAPQEQVDEFQNTLVRLVSLLHALSLEGLERKADVAEVGHRFEIIGWSDLSDELQIGLQASHCNVEHVFQSVQQLVVDAMRDNVLNIAPPILTRSFQEMGAGLLLYHEAQKLSRVPFPRVYRLFTHMVLVAESIFAPFVLALSTKGPTSAFFFTFAGTYLLWLLNAVADTLDNPFKKEACTLDPASVQSELNIQLRQLIVQSSQATPSLRHSIKGVRLSRLQRGDSLPTVRKTITYFSSEEGKDVEESEEVLSNVEETTSRASMRDSVGQWLPPGLRADSPVAGEEELAVVGRGRGPGWREAEDGSRAARPMSARLHAPSAGTGQAVEPSVLEHGAAAVSGSPPPPDEASGREGHDIVTVEWSGSANASI